MGLFKEKYWVSQRSANYSLQADYLLLWIQFYAHIAMLISICIVSGWAAFSIQWQSGEAATETTCSQNLTEFLSGPSQKTFAHTWYKRLSWWCVAMGKQRQWPANDLNHEQWAMGRSLDPRVRAPVNPNSLAYHEVSSPEPASASPSVKWENRPTEWGPCAE